MKPELHMIVVLMFWQGLNSITSKASAEIMQLFKGLAVFAEDQTVPGEKCGETCLNDGDYCLYLCSTGDQPPMGEYDPRATFRTQT